MLPNIVCEAGEGNGQCPTLPRRQKSAPASPPSGPRVSAALRSRDAGEGRASLGDPGCCLGDGAPASVGGCCLMAVLVREAKPLRVDSTFRLSDSRIRRAACVVWTSRAQLTGRGHEKKRRRRRIHLITTSLRHSPLFYTPLYSSLSIASSLFCSSTPSSLNNIPLALATFARLLARRLILAVLFTLSRISIGTEKTPEAATIVPSAPSYAHSLLVLLAQAPLPSILEPRDLPRFHPVPSAPRVFSVGPPYIPGNSCATALPTCIHGLLVMATVTRKASATKRATLR